MSTETFDAAAVYRRADSAFASRVALIGDRWSAPTPCPGWDVRALVHHVVEEERWAPPLLAGATIADVGDRFAGDLLGGDPIRAHTEAAAEATAAISADGALDRTVHLSFGDVPGHEYAMQLTADHLIHAWDLARALDADTSLDREAVAVVRAWFERHEGAYRSAGLIGPRGHLPDGAGPQEELLAMFGRTP